MAIFCLFFDPNSTACWRRARLTDCRSSHNSDPFEDDDWDEWDPSPDLPEPTWEDWDPADDEPVEPQRGDFWPEELDDEWARSPAG